MPRSSATQAATGRSGTPFGHGGVAGAQSLARRGDVGTVVAFDADAGLGTVRSDDGSEYRFHCVEIADGTRSIDVGALVEFGRLPKLGAYEAGCLTQR